MATDQLYDFCNALLADAVDILDDAGLVVPSRQFVSATTPAEDCDTIAVWVDNLGPWATAGRQDRAPCGFVTSAGVNLRIIMCQDEGGNEGQPVPVAQLDTFGLEHHQRGWVLWNGLLSLWTSSTGAAFTDRRCDTVRDWEMVQTEYFGGTGGWTISFEMQIGNEPSLGS